MVFRIPVRAHQIWQSASVRESLEATLGFLADEHYTFEFSPMREKSVGSEEYFFDLTDGAAQPDEIALFSHISGG